MPKTKSQLAVSLQRDCSIPGCPVYVRLWDTAIKAQKRFFIFQHPSELLPDGKTAGAWAKRLLKHTGNESLRLLLEPMVVEFCCIDFNAPTPSDKLPPFQRNTNHYRLFEKYRRVFVEHLVSPYPKRMISPHAGAFLMSLTRDNQFDSACDSGFISGHWVEMKTNK